MEVFLIKAFQLILSLAILVVLHELGHFIPAKIFKTRVEKFYLFFDVKFSLFKKKIGETVYGIGWLPDGSGANRWGTKNLGFTNSPYRGEKTSIAGKSVNISEKFT